MLDGAHHFTMYTLDSIAANTNQWERAIDQSSSQSTNENLLAPETTAHRKKNTIN